MSKNVPVIEVANFAEEDNNQMRGTSVGQFPALGGGWEVCMIVVFAVGCSSKCAYYFRIIWQLFSYYLAVMTMMGWRRQLQPTRDTRGTVIQPAIKNTMEGCRCA